MSRRALIFGLPRRLVRDQVADTAATTSRREIDPRVRRSDLRPHGNAHIDGLLQQLGNRAGAAKETPNPQDEVEPQEAGDEKE